MSHKVLSFDLGGTKVAAGIVNSTGKVLEELRVPVSVHQGKQAVLQQLYLLGQKFLKQHREINRIGIASAGPLDPEKGELLEPTNFAGQGKPWGKVPLTHWMRKNLNCQVYLENDAAAAALAEHWVGSGKKYKNMMVLTLGTGLGTGILVNGKLLRSGRNLHPEAGHMVIRLGDQSAPCGCGNLGCAEAYLSGKNFEQRARIRLGRSDLINKDIANLARRGHPEALALFEEYSELMSIAVHNFVRLFNPEILIFTGSFANTADLFLKNTEKKLKKLLARQQTVMKAIPKLTVSKLKNNSGLIGGAYIALHHPLHSVERSQVK